MVWFCLFRWGCVKFSVFTAENRQTSLGFAVHHISPSLSPICQFAPSGLRYVTAACMLIDIYPCVGIHVFDPCVAVMVEMLLWNAHYCKQTNWTQLQFYHVSTGFCWFHCKYVRESTKRLCDLMWYGHQVSPALLPDLAKSQNLSFAFIFCRFPKHRLQHSRLRQQDKWSVTESTLKVAVYWYPIELIGCLWMVINTLTHSIN